MKRFPTISFKLLLILLALWTLFFLLRVSTYEFKFKIEKRKVLKEKPLTSSKTSKITPPAPTKILSSSYKAIYIYFGDDPVAYAIAKAESGLNCSQISQTSDYGLYQIHLPLHQWRFDKFGGKWDNCWDNARVAKQIYDEQGWSPWTVWQSGVYLSFLNTYEKKR
jgi:hypothetical protein